MHIYKFWDIFTGLCTEAGDLIANFVLSIYQSEYVQNLYQKIYLSDLYNRGKWAFFRMYGFILAVALFKVCLFIRLSALCFCNHPDRWREY